MLIVSGQLTVAANTRDDYLAGCVAVIDQARRTDGCLDFAISPDVVGADRVDVYERWATRAAVEAFRGSGPDVERQVAMLAASVAEYEVGEVRTPS